MDDDDDDDGGGGGVDSTPLLSVRWCCCVMLFKSVDYILNEYCWFIFVCCWRTGRRDILFIIKFFVFVRKKKIHSSFLLMEMKINGN